VPRYGQHEDYDGEDEVGKYFLCTHYGFGVAQGSCVSQGSRTHFHVFSFTTFHLLSSPPMQILQPPPPALFSQKDIRLFNFLFVAVS